VDLLAQALDHVQRGDDRLECTGQLRFERIDLSF
jgi:hypothetical protein